MNIGVIGLRDAWSTESLSQHLKEKNAGGAIIELSELSYDLSDSDFSHPSHDINSFDGFILKKMGKSYSANLLDELELLRLMERNGFHFFSSPESIRKMISRLSCTIMLQDHDIPMPPTFITESIDEALNYIANSGEVILKPLYSTKAKGMELLSDVEAARIKLQAHLDRGEKIFYLQQKYDLNQRDYGIVFLGGKYIGAFERESDGSTWHTTTLEGGKYKAYDPPERYIELAAKAQEPFNLDFVCVDVANTVEVGPVVFEVSAFGGYKGLYESSNIDASDMVTDYAINSLKNRIKD
ncbi:MAG: tetrahydromethanopterin:alpha-L-glutamate ligase [Candidatus Azotimanducaceae bacterium]|jgi:tetrahydromethanopterin:alpha-L-glutamate ligase